MFLEVLYASNLGGLYSEGLTETGGGLYAEGLTDTEGLICGGAYFRNFTVSDPKRTRQCRKVFWDITDTF